MAGPGSGVAGKHLEVEPTVRVADELRPPGFEIVHHVDDIVDPDARELRIYQFAAVFQDVLEMKFRAVVLAHGGGQASARHGDRAARGATLGYLDDCNARFRAFKCGHGASRAAPDDQYVGFVAYNRNVEADRV